VIYLLRPNKSTLEERSRGTVLHNTECHVSGIICVLLSSVLTFLGGKLLKIKTAHGTLYFRRQFRTE